ncbi:MAG: NFACT family protein [Chloroflexota bacterium]|nr:NFACT family protein [Chloroflexota bacterium]
MYLDAFTLSALTDELLDTIAGGRIQDVLDVNETAVGLEIYAARKRHYLYVSADPNTPRIHLVEERLRRGLPKPTPLGLLLRRHAEGGSISHVSQPPWERSLQIDIEGSSGSLALVIEPMERRANLLLLQDGIILECIRRVRADDRRSRAALPGHPYEPPTPQSDKLDPTRLTQDELTAFLAGETDPKRKTHQILTGNLLGFSPLLAKEVAYRAAGTTDQRATDADAGKLYAALQTVITPLAKRDWQPGVVEADGVVTAYSVYPLQSLEGWRATESVSAALAAFYGAPVGEHAYDRAKEPIREQLKEATARLNGRLVSLRRSMTDDSEREQLKQSGELILAYQYALEPGQTELRAQYDADQPELVIRLDPELSALENAQRYFEKYNKAKRALDDVPRLIEENEAELAFVQQLGVDLDLASSYPDIDEVQQALQAKGLWRGTAKRVPGGQRSAPLRVVTPDGWVIWIGRNSRQNEQVTFDKGSPSDTWLHVRDVPGAHVIIKSDGRPIPDAIIERAAGYAAHFSSLRHEAKAPVDVTLRVHVRKIKGAAVGMVTYRNERTLMVTPRGVAADE